jgi:hypothetical protein
VIIPPAAFSVPSAAAPVTVSGPVFNVIVFPAPAVIDCTVWFVAASAPTVCVEPAGSVTAHVEVGTAFVLQFPAVPQSVVPAPPVHIGVHTLPLSEITTDVAL